MSLLLQLLDRGNNIPVNKVLIKALGLEEAIILGELLTEYNRWEVEDKLVDGMFFCTVAKLEDNTGLSDYQQRKAIRSLESCGIITTKLKGTPAIRYFQVDEDKLLNILRTRSEKTKELDLEKLQSSNILNSNIENSNKVFLSKDKNTSNFEFGKPKSSNTKKPTLYSKCVSHIYNFSNNTELQDKLIEFLRTLAEMDKLRGERQFIGILNKLKEFTDDIDEQLRIIENSLDNGYATFYNCIDNSTRFNHKQASSDIGVHTQQYTKEQINQIKKGVEDGTSKKF